MEKPLLVAYRMHKALLQSNILVAALIVLNVLFLILSSDFFNVHQYLLAFLFIFTLMMWALVMIGDNSRSVQLKKWGAIATLLLAIVLPTVHSLDVYSYAFYGRMQSAYGLSPYLNSPMDLSSDVWFDHISSNWHDARSLYGPSFTWLSGHIAELSNGSIQLAALGFRLFAGMCALFSVLLLAGETGKATAYSAFLLNPLVLLLGVNDAHVDLAVGTFILAAVVVIAKGIGLKQLFFSAVLIAVAMSLKATALLGLIGLAIYVAYRSRGIQVAFLNVAIVAVAAATSFAILSTLAGGSDFVKPLLDASGKFSNYSLTNLFLSAIEEIGFSVSTKSASIVLMGLLTLSTIGSAIYGCIKNNVGFAIGFPLFMYVVVGSYVLGWYVLWSFGAFVFAAINGVSKRPEGPLQLWPVIVTFVGGCLSVSYYGAAFGPVLLFLSIGVVVSAYRTLEKKKVEVQQ